MKVRIRHQRADELVAWLEEHVGPRLNTKPIVFWNGQGWRMRMIPSPMRTGTDPYRWSVDIDDPELATFCMLRWS